MCSSSKWSEVEPEYCSETFLKPSADVIVAAREKGVSSNLRVFSLTFWELGGVVGFLGEFTLLNVTKV